MSGGETVARLFEQMLRRDIPLEPPRLIAHFLRALKTEDFEAVWSKLQE